MDTVKNMSAGENAEGEFVPLQKDESKVQESPNVDTSEVHQEGIEHIKGNTEALSQQQAPASNLGSDVPSSGIAAGSGGTSSEPTMLDYSGEGVQEEVPSEVETTPKAGAPSVDQESTGGPSNWTSTGDTFVGSGGAASASTGSTVAATSEQTSSAPMTTEQPEVTPVTDTAEVGTGRNLDMADSAQKDVGRDHNEETHENEVTQDEKIGDDEDEAKVGDEDPKKAPVRAVRENKSAIPTAGGIQLGEKHWGESKIVPDVPKKSDEEGTGQTDKQTADNTAKNAGGISGGSSDQSKHGMGEMIKGMLHKG